MDVLGHTRRLFAYDDWANREMISSLNEEKPSQRALSLMAHVVVSEQLWHARLNCEASPREVWPELSLEECQEKREGLTAMWDHYFDGLSSSDLERSIEYTNTRGVDYSTPIGDILTHVIIHSAYHRGQIAADVRASGHTPAYTDFIHCVRGGFVD